MCLLNAFTLVDNSGLLQHMWQMCLWNCWMTYWSHCTGSIDMLILRNDLLIFVSLNLFASPSTRVLFETGCVCVCEGVSCGSVWHLRAVYATTQSAACRPVRCSRSPCSWLYSVSSARNSCDHVGRHVSWYRSSCPAGSVHIVAQIVVSVLLVLHARFYVVSVVDNVN